LSEPTLGTLISFCSATKCTASSTRLQKSPGGFAQDICQDINEPLARQEKIILSLDGNSDMRDSPLATALKNCFMTEALLQRHGFSGPSTFRWNNTRTPIDGIWISPGISISAGGYLDYDCIIPGADHRTLWIDVSFINALGHVMPAIIRPQARRLNCRDPRIVENYVRRYEKLAIQHELLPKTEQFLEKARYPLSRVLQAEFEELDNIRCIITQEAEKRCRKLRMGQVSFSPELRQASRGIKIFTLLHKRLLQ
jgi:hypothetical protein